MKKIFLTSLFLFAFVMSASAQNAKIEQAIIQLEKEWVEALVKTDVAVLERIYSDSLTYTHSNSLTDSKASYIANLKTGKTKYESLEREEVKVRVYGNTALHTSKTNIKLVTNGQPSAFS